MRIPERNLEETETTRQQAVASLSPQEEAVMLGTLAANKEKNFVQRILNAGDWPVQANPGNSYSSHRMASADNYAFPTLFYDKASNALYQPPDPIAEAKRLGEYIEFPDPASAERFASGGYKAGMGTGLLPKIREPQEDALARLLR